MSSFLNSIFLNISFLPLLVPSPFTTSFNRDSIPSCFHHQKSSSLNISPGHSFSNVSSLIILLSIFLQKIVRIFDPKLILKERPVAKFGFGVLKKFYFSIYNLFMRFFIKKWKEELIIKYNIFFFISLFY